MGTSIIRVTNGPDKSDLLHAFSKSDQQFHATFDTPDGPIEARIEVIEEQGSDGAGLTMWAGERADEVRLPVPSNLLTSQSNRPVCELHNRLQSAPPF